ncbi:choice-of-anchor D domain-containing protein, partial [Flavobacteriaceae bacterium]|nr:choice-of-anchor D domain-containing protein [Flavobacteriaceae bacterium]
IKLFNNLRPFFILITLVFVGPIVAQNTITAENNNGLYNENLTLSFSLDNTDEIAALQFDVVYDPLAFAISGSAQLDPAIVNHSIGSSQPESGRLRIVIFSLSGDVISAGNQSLLTVPITTKYEPGDFTLTIENIVASDAIGAALSAVGSNGNLLVEGPKFVLVSQNIDFGEVPMLSAPTQSMTIQNQGNTELVLNSYTVNTPPFLTNTFPVSIPAFGSTQLTVGLETTAKQLVNEQLSISTNDPSAFRATQRSTILADIFAVNEIYIGSGSGPINTNVSIPVTVENMEPFNGFQFDITLPQDITYVPGSVALSGREVDHSVAASMINSNTLRILGYSLNNEDFTGTTGELLSFELLPAVSSGTYPLNIQNPILTHVDFGNIISEAYNGQISINAPNLSLSTSSIDFGRVPINDIGEEIVTLTNNGSLALEIDEVVYNDPTLTSTITTPLVLDISESSQETITFTPAQTGLFNSSISIRHNGSAGQNVISIAADVFSPNYLLIEERFAYPGTSAQVSLQGSFYEDIRGIQFDINVPTDFTLDLASVTEEMALSNFQVSSAALGNGDYRFIIYTLSSDLISSGTVPLLQLPIAVSPDAFGDYPMAISNVVLSNIDNQNIASEALLEGVVHVVENLPPTASDQTISTPEDTTAEIILVGADPYNDPLTYIIVDQPTNGTAVLTGNTVDYTPDGDYNGPDSFTFKANDGTTD